MIGQTEKQGGDHGSDNDDGNPEDSQGLAQRQIPIGTAYAVWTGIGAAGTFLIGIAFFGDAAGPLRLLSFALIIAGIIGLKLSQ